MQVFKVVLGLAAAACGAQVNVLPDLQSRSAPAECSGGRFASVTNPTTAAVNVFVERRQGRRTNTTKLGTVDAGSTAEFELSSIDENRLRFEWAAGSTQHATSDLSQVRYKIHCETQPRDF